jgi:Molybdopterin converting factor, small subunit
MIIQVKAFARFRELFGGEFLLTLPDGSTTGDAVEKIAARVPGGKEALYNEEGTIRPYIIILINKKRLSGDDRAARSLAGGDELALLPPVAGG